jgi:hypothetical protein
MMKGTTKMEMVTSPVKVRQKNEEGKMTGVKVGDATYPVYTTVAEAVGHVGEDQVVILINTQSKTNELNRVRSLHTNGPGKAAMRSEALNWLSANWGPEDWQKVAGVPGALEAAINKKADEIARERRTAAGLSEDGEEGEEATS